MQKKLWILNTLPVRAKVFDVDNIKLLPLQVGCSKSMIFFCTFFDLDKEAFY